MNEITLIGYLRCPPTYHCTAQGQDLARFEVRTVVSGNEDRHHCIAWGPAALDLHTHLHPGDRLLIRGELRYRLQRNRWGGVLRVPEVYVKAYSYLGRPKAAAE